MTDRHSGYLVILEDDIREDDAEATIDALSMIKGVLTVKPVTHDASVVIATERLRKSWMEMLWRLATQAQNFGPDSVAPRVVP